MSEANRLLTAAAEIQAFCTSAGWKFCFIGGVAVQHWGEPRLTRDADLTVFTGVGDEQRYVDALLEQALQDMLGASGRLGARILGAEGGFGFSAQA